MGNLGSIDPNNHSGATVAGKPGRGEEATGLFGRRTWWADALYRRRAWVAALFAIGELIALLWLCNIGPRRVEQANPVSLPVSLLAEKPATSVDPSPTLPPESRMREPRRSVPVERRREPAAPSVAASAAIPPSSSMVPATPVVAAPVTAPSNRALEPVPDRESAYIAQVRARLEASKRYPTGREVSQERPAGNVHLWFVLRRDGSLVEVGIERSSGSLLLDQAALSSVRRATFPPFGESLWPERSQSRFAVVLQFHPLQ